MRKIILTVDLETDWETDETQAIEEILPKFLKFLKSKKAKATFFVVGELAEKHQTQIKEILKQGHEVASHSLTHRKLSNLTFDEIEKEVSESKKILEKLGAKVEGFRSPGGVMPKELAEILKQYEYKYDSSVIASFLPGRYSNLGKSKPYKLDNKFIELPVPNFSVFKIPAGLPATRLFYPLVKNQFAKEPYMIYLHLHEFIKKPQSKNIPIHLRIASLRNRGDKAWNIFKKFVEQSNAKFITCKEFIR